MTNSLRFRHVGMEPASKSVRFASADRTAGRQRQQDAPMPQLLNVTCTSCGRIHEVHRHDVSVHNHDRLLCPACGGVLVNWEGTFFFTLAVSRAPYLPTFHASSDASETQQRRPTDQETEELG